MSDEDINNQVLFWQRLIEWWETNNDDPVPERMNLALRFAKVPHEVVSGQSSPGTVLH